LRYIAFAVKVGRFNFPPDMIGQVSIRATGDRRRWRSLEKAIHAGERSLPPFGQLAQVFCRYFVYAQRPEDRVLRTLVEKTERIRQELGSLGRVVEPKINARLSGGIKRAEVED